MVEDVSHAVVWTHQNIEKYGGDVNKIFLVGIRVKLHIFQHTGHSAGAHLCALYLIKRAFYQLNGGIPFSLQYSF